MRSFRWISVVCLVTTSFVLGCGDTPPSPKESADGANTLSPPAVKEVGGKENKKPAPKQPPIPQH